MINILDNIEVLYHSCIKINSGDVIKVGDINVFTGPMKCGKTQKILDEAQRQQIAGKNIKVFASAN